MRWAAGVHAQRWLMAQDEGTQRDCHLFVEELRKENTLRIEPWEMAQKLATMPCAPTQPMRACAVKLSALGIDPDGCALKFCNWTAVGIGVLHGNTPAAWRARSRHASVKQDMVDLALLHVARRRMRHSLFRPALLRHTVAGSALLPAGRVLHLR